MAQGNDIYNMSVRLLSQPTATTSTASFSATTDSRLPDDMIDVSKPVVTPTKNKPQDYEGMMSVDSGENEEYEHPHRNQTNPRRASRWS